MLSQKVQNLIDAILGKTADTTIGKGKKLTLGADGRWSLEPDLERFEKSRSLSPAATALCKSMTAPTTTDLAAASFSRRYVTKVGGSLALNAGFKLAKTAAMPLLTDEELRGTTPVVWAKPRGATPGLSDKDLQILEDAIVDESLTPAAANRRFLDVYRIISAHPGQTAADLIALNLRGRA
jgi:hypothetical protein